MGETKLFYDEFISPIGPLLIVSDGTNIVRIDYGRMDDLEEKLDKWGRRYFGNPVFIYQAVKAEYARKELQAYFTGSLTKFSMPIAFHGTPFQKKVWQALYDTIPYGKTKTYKDIALDIGNPKAVRAVGGAVNKNPFSIVVPCHRVIGTNGKMVGYNGGVEKKAYLLEHEKANIGEILTLS